MRVAGLWRERQWPSAGQAAGEQCGGHGGGGSAADAVGRACEAEGGTRVAWLDRPGEERVLGDGRSAVPHAEEGDEDHHGDGRRVHPGQQPEGQRLTAQRHHHEQAGRHSPGQPSGGEPGDGDRQRGRQQAQARAQDRRPGPVASHGRRFEERRHGEVDDADEGRRDDEEHGPHSHPGQREEAQPD
jgi:hypothetical protein